MKFEDRLREERLVPVAVIDRKEDAVPLAQALMEGGLHTIEVTFRTEAAKGALEAICASDTGIFAGAGTILTVEQAKEAVAAGAKFLVSPCLVPEVVRYGESVGIPVIPGCVTPTELAQAKALGLSLVKFFPAEVFGGVKTIKTYASVFSDLMIMPTGGIGMGNLKEYLSCSNVIACGGSFMVKKEWMREGAFDKIAACAKEARELCTTC